MEMLDLDLDSFDTYEEAVYHLHNDKGECGCKFCEGVRGK